ncbi:MAG TPA: hypothetical protein PKC67_10450 [Kiritimatiellia bacterium]|nr:hypothetical protein [Kiritimatiellia bacterium]HMP34759.1 hypothetical protein [Kiritimatiellia bacterium]
MKTATMMLLVLLAGAVRLPAATTPEELAELYFNAIKDGDVETLAAHMHAEELLRFRDVVVPIIESRLGRIGVAGDPEVAVMNQLLGGDSVERLREEPPDEFFMRFLRWINRNNPMFAKMLQGARFEALGHITEADMAHVTCRVHVWVMGSDVAQLKVVSVRKQEDGWRLMVAAELEGMAKVLQFMAVPAAERSRAAP